MVCTGIWLLVLLLCIELLQLSPRRRLEIRMHVLDWHDPLQLDLRGDLGVFLRQGRQVASNAPIVLLQMLIDSREVLDTISIICAVHVATDHFKTAFL